MSSSDSKPLRVFISYSQESHEHRVRVFELANWLRTHGVECVTDHTLFNPPAGWRAWMEDELRAADFALVVCTETYRRRAERREAPGKGLGVTWEAALITDELYQNANRNTRFIPVVFADEDKEHIPDRLRQFTFYVVNADEGRFNLLRHLTNQPLFEPAPLGTVPKLPPLVPAQSVTVEPQPVQPVPPSHNVTVDLGQGVKLEMIYLPGGTFQMGSNEDKSEQPIHRVTLSPFHIGKHQVTQAQWQAVMGDAPSYFFGEDFPVEKVTWHEAVEFCVRLSQKTNYLFRLPSEAEWEYSCRAGSPGKWCFGNDESLLETYAWYGENVGMETHSVLQKKPNAFELYDMHGNVWEWCDDVWHDDYNNAPTDGSSWLSGIDTTWRVVRGGSRSSQAGDCRSASRDCHYFVSGDMDTGFRVVMSLRTQ